MYKNYVCIRRDKKENVNESIYLVSLVLDSKLMSKR